MPGRTGRAIYIGGQGGYGAITSKIFARPSTADHAVGIRRQPATGLQLAAARLVATTAIAPATARLPATTGNGTTSCWASKRNYIHGGFKSTSISAAADASATTHLRGHLPLMSPRPPRSSAMSRLRLAPRRAPAMPGDASCLTRSSAAAVGKPTVGRLLPIGRIACAARSVTYHDAGPLRSTQAQHNLSTAITAGLGVDAIWSVACSSRVEYEYVRFTSDIDTRTSTASRRARLQVLTRFAASRLTGSPRPDALSLKWGRQRCRSTATAIPAIV